MMVLASLSTKTSFSPASAHFLAQSAFTLGAHFASVIQPVQLQLSASVMDAAITSNRNTENILFISVPSRNLGFRLAAWAAPRCCINKHSTLFTAETDLLRWKCGTALGRSHGRAIQSGTGLVLRGE